MRNPKSEILLSLTLLLALFEGTASAESGSLSQWQTVLDTWQRNRESFGLQLTTFVSLAAQGVGLALIIGLPMGIGLTRLKGWASPSMSMLAVVQTVPSLALLGLLIPLIGIGRPPALVATVLYSLLPIVMNTYVGIVQVSPSVRDAATGLGMTSGQILRKVELPLALPVILAGVRTGVVYAIGVITVCALAGAGGLGEYITRGLSRGDDGLILLGALPILLITLLGFWAIGGIASLAKQNVAAGLALAAMLTGTLAAYAVVESLPKGRADLIIGSKSFTENILLAEIMRQMLEAHTDLEIVTRFGLGSNMAYKAVLSGDTDLYPAYTGTLLTAVDGLNETVPEDRSVITGRVRQGMADKFDLMLLNPFGLNNTHAMCVPRRLAEQYGLRTIGDLKRIADLKAAFASEFLDRPDGWPNLAKTYGLHLTQRPAMMEPELMYVAMREGQADLCSGFSTDWQIKDYDLVILEDTLNYFPSYHAAPLVRRAVLRKHPEVQEVLDRLGGAIDDDTIRSMNAEVAVKKRSESDVAREFLLARGLIQ